MDWLSTLWQRVSATQEPLPPAIAAITMAVAALVVLTPGAWHLARHAITIAHEGGHAVAATLSGRRLSGIRLHADTSGLTLSRGRTRGPGMVMTLLAGYPAAGLLGLGAAWMLSRGFAVGMLWALLGLLTLLLLQVRNWFGLWSVLVTGAILVFVTWFGAPDVQGIFSLLVTTFLLLGSVRTVLELQASRRRRRGGLSDADQLARITRVPGIFWVGLLLAITIGCAVASAVLLGVTSWLPGT